MIYLSAIFKGGIHEKEVVVLQTIEIVELVLDHATYRLNIFSNTEYLS